MREEDKFKALTLKLSNQVSSLTQIVSKLMTLQLELKQENLELRQLIHPFPIEPAPNPFSSGFFHEPLPIKLLTSSSPPNVFDTDNDLVMSYFASTTSTPEFDPRSVFRSDKSPMMGYQETFLNLPISIPRTISPTLMSSSPPQSSRALCTKRKFTRKMTGPLNILIVEDDPLCQQLISHIIKSLHVGDCEIVADGVEAVINMSTNSFDLILMDIQLPLLDGLQATQNIRKFNRRTPIVSMTAQVSDEDIKKYFEGGIDDILPKPFDKQSVKNIIQQFYKFAIEE